MMGTKHSHFARTDRATMTVRRLRDGLVTEMDPANAREAVEGGHYEYVDASEPSIRERLEAMPQADLEALAKEVKVRTHNEQRSHVEARLVPMIELGELTLP